MESSIATKSSVYDAYLANWTSEHPEVKVPVVVHQFDWQGKDISSLIDECVTDFGHIGKFLTYGNSKSKLKSLDNGQCIEIGSDVRGCFLFALWNNKTDALNFKKPDSYREFHGDW